MRAWGFLSRHAFCMTAAEHNNQTNQASHVSRGATTSRRAAFRRGLTGVGGSEVVGVAGEEGLVVLGRQVHVIVSQWLSTCDPRIPAGTRRAHF